MNEDNFDLSDVPYSHHHEWRVVGLIGLHFLAAGDGEKNGMQPGLLLRCEPCGCFGIVKDPSPAELRRAYRPYRWFAHHRIDHVGFEDEGPAGTKREVHE